MNDIQADVRQFMAAFNQAMPETPQWPDQATMDLRVRLVAEEFCEWLRDSGLECKVVVQEVVQDKDEDLTERKIFRFDNTNCMDVTSCETRSLPKTTDAIIDQIYVLIGSLLAMGIDFWPLWAEVQRKNMEKVGGPIINGKVTKPAGWTPPDIEGELRKQGWEEPA